MTNTTLSHEETQVGGLPVVLTALEARNGEISKNNAGYYVTSCPVEHNHKNGDQHPSLNFREFVNQDDPSDTHVFLKCWSGGCTPYEILQALGLKENDLYSKPGAMNGLRAYLQTKAAQRALTLPDFASAKKLPLQFLMMDMLLHDDVLTFHKDGKPYKVQGVVFPYLLPDGTLYERYKLRKAMQKGKYPVFQWNEGDEPSNLFYGLHGLHNAKTQHRLIIVEGESDTCTLLFHQLPALGISGGNNVEKTIETTLQLVPDLLENLDTIYVSQEKTDQTGIDFPYRVHAALHERGYTGQILRVPLRNLTGVKDPSELHVKLYEQARFTSEMEFHQSYQAEIQKCLDQAKPMDGDTSGVLPKIIIDGRQYREVSEQALEALSVGEKANPYIFVKAGSLVRVALNEKGGPILQSLGIAEIRNALTRTADYYRTRKVPKSDDKVELVPISPPKELAEYILAMNPSEWPFPPLVGIIEMPIMRQDGSILDSPGYDHATHLYYVANTTMKKCKIPRHPTQGQLSQAVALINTCIGDFYYETDADKANMFALLVTLVTRYMYDGDVMTALINATKQGSGKSLLAKFACILATGRPPAMTNFPAKEEEVKKVLDAKVLAGVQAIVFDNIKRKFQSAALDMLSTCSGYYSLRPLGYSKDIEVYTQTTVVATGNNVQMDTDQARRCYQIRLTSPISNPDERDDIHIKDLERYAIEHRAELVAALLTIVRSWYVNGKPQAKNKLQASSFGRWAGTVGSILAHTDITGFQENRDTLKAETNSDEQQIADFLQTWRTLYPDFFPAMTILDRILDDVSIENEVKEGEPSGLLATLPDDLRVKLFDRERKKQSMIQIFVKWLAARIKTPFGSKNLRIECNKDEAENQKIWCVVTGGPEVPEVKQPIATRKNLENDNISSNNNNNAYRERPFLPPVPPDLRQNGQSEEAYNRDLIKRFLLELSTAQVRWEVVPGQEVKTYDAYVAAINSMIKSGKTHEALKSVRARMAVRCTHA